MKVNGIKHIKIAPYTPSFTYCLIPRSTTEVSPAELLRDIYTPILICSDLQWNHKCYRNRRVLMIIRMFTIGQNRKLSTYVNPNGYQVTKWNRLDLYHIKSKVVITVSMAKTCRSTVRIQVKILAMFQF